MGAPAANQPDELDEATFVAIRKLVHEKSGIYLKGDKRNLVATRLAKRLRQLGLSSYRAYLQALQRDSAGAELTVLLDSISTNVTSFFREADHFDVVRATVGQWKADGQTRFRFWSAASSSGEEPYSLAITLQDVGTRGLDMKILATDISTRILAKAMAGRYPKNTVEPVPAMLRTKYFTIEGEEYVVTPQIRDMVMFRRANLSQLPTPVRGPLDIVFCRNVMIYFEEPLRRALVQEFARVLKPGGYLLVGHSESLVGMQGELEAVRPSVYRKPGGRR